MALTVRSRLAQSVLPARYNPQPFVAVRAPARPVITRADPNNNGATSSTSTSTQSNASPSQREELPIWVRRENERKLQEQDGKKDLPWGLYLLFSTFTAIAAVGSIFEFVDKNPVFGVIPPENPLWAPILLTFAVTGFPTAGFLFFKGVNGFNEAAERQDRLDGYIE